MTDPVPYVLPGWDDDPGPAGTAPAGTVQRRRRVRVLLWTLVVVLVLGGGVALFLGLAQAGHVEAAPVPAHAVQAPAHGPVNGATGKTPVQTNAGAMTVAKMAPMHYFVPALRAYSQIVPSDRFLTRSGYRDFDTLWLPDDVEKTAWYSKGGSLGDDAPGTTGTTFLASHVSLDGRWGVLRYLYQLKGGEVIYVKDAAGHLTAWKVTRLYTLRHTSFPQDYWSASGVRQLVLTTCGDYDPRTGNYTENVFAVATPVDPATGRPLAASSVKPGATAAPMASPARFA